MKNHNQAATVLLTNEEENPPVSRMLPAFYDQIRVLAEGFMRNERRDHTLQATALVHETLLRLMEAENIEWRGKAQFMALAAEQIRKILVDHARRHRAAKRGGDRQRTCVNWEEMPEAAGSVDILDLDHALDALDQRCPRQRRVVELRFFAGLGVAEIAELLDVSERTVKGDWRAARAWLRQQVAP